MSSRYTPPLPLDPPLLIPSLPPLDPLLPLELLPLELLAPLELLPLELLAPLDPLLLEPPMRPLLTLRGEGRLLAPSLTFSQVHLR
ncbi:MULTISPECIES: hypothetical protein [unclassified Mesorhizobium]|uniref:hypothetical protein n=1 Tax=unclassified Mesorhizobium TaxID=325217 RepID=UPI00333B442E